VFFLLPFIGRNYFSGPTVVNTPTIAAAATRCITLRVSLVGRSTGKDNGPIQEISRRISEAIWKIKIGRETNLPKIHRKTAAIRAGTKLITITIKAGSGSRGEPGPDRGIMRGIPARLLAIK
jgi:hypothetical protein